MAPIHVVPVSLPQYPMTHIHVLPNVSDIVPKYLDHVKPSLKLATWEIHEGNIIIKSLNSFTGVCSNLTLILEIQL